MECNFYVGQEVICVNDDPNMLPNPPSEYDLDGLTAGNKYTVSFIYIDPWFNLPCVVVKEIHRSVMYEGNDAGYFASRFRPLQKKQTNISALQGLLQPSEKVLEDA